MCDEFFVTDVTRILIVLALGYPVFCRTFRYENPAFSPVLPKKCILESKFSKIHVRNFQYSPLCLNEPKRRIPYHQKPQDCVFRLGPARSNNLL